MAVMTIPELLSNPRFESVSYNKTTELSRIIQSGIALSDASLEQIIASFSNSGNYVQGDTINMPFLNDNNEPDQILSDNVPLVPSGTNMGQDQASVCRTGHAFGATDLAQMLGSVDPVLEVSRFLADYWNRMYQRQLFAVLEGIFAKNALPVAQGGNDADLVMDITGEDGDDAVLSAKTLLFGQQLLGDAKEGIAAIGVHSQVETHLNAIGAISTTVTAEADRPAVLKHWNGKEVFMDDNCKFDGEIAEIYMFKRGAIALNNVPLMNAYEEERDGLAGKSWFISRRGRVMHMRGVRYTKAAQADASATNAEYANPANWSRLWDKKRIGVVKIIAKLPK